MTNPGTGCASAEATAAAAPAHATRTRVSWRTAVRQRLSSSWPPIAVWLLATTVVLVTAAASGWPPLDGGRTWSRWDSAIYMSIARDGYTLAPCQHIRGAWCGTTAWFPGYPWVVHTAHWLGLPIIATALAVSWLAFLITLVLIWTVFLNQRPTVPAAAALLYAGFAPGVIYNYAIFPLALLSLCTVAFLALLHHERWRAASLTGACAALVYPVGVVASPVAALWLLARRDIRLHERLRHTAVILGSWIGALALLVIDQRLETGRWNAFLLVQRNYRHHIQDPFSVLRAAFDNVLNKPPLGLAATSAAQTLLVTFVLLCVLIALDSSGRRSRQSKRWSASGQPRRGSCRM